MLYPEFDELVSYKDLKVGSRKSFSASKSLKSASQRSVFRGRGLEFDSVRQYVLGDDIRSIDWRVTARTGSPHLKIYQEERQRHIVLCLDMNAKMRFGTRKTFKSVQAARIVSLLGWQALAHQDKISTCLFGDVPGGIEFFTPKYSRTCFLQVLKRLSASSPEKFKIPLIEVFARLSEAVQQGSVVYFISDFMDMEKKADVYLSRLNTRCDVVFISINDPADMALIPVGKLRISNGSKSFEVNTDSLNGRTVYQEKWLENRKDLYQKVNQFKIPLVELTTESDIKRDLWIAIKGLSKR